MTSVSSPLVNGLVSFTRDQSLTTPQKARAQANIGIDFSSLVPYTGATGNVDLASYFLTANRIFIGGSTGPQLDNSSGTIRARTNNGLSAAPISASSLTATSLTGLTAGYMALIDSITLGWPGTSYGGFQAGSNGSFGFYAGPKFDQSGGTIRARANLGIEVCNLSGSAYAPVKSGFFSLSADPSTLDLASGGVSVYKNTTSGALKLWANDGGTMKSVTLN